MRPVFTKKQDAIGFISFVVFLVLLPAILKAVGLPSRQSRYAGAPNGDGPVANIESTVFEDKEPSDVVLCGSSETLAAMIPSNVERYFSENLGKKAVVKYLCLFHLGADAQYVFLHDYLDTHSCKLLVLEVANPVSVVSGPQNHMYHFWRYGDFAEEFGSLSVREKTQLYSTMVLGSLRQALDLVRPNLLGDDEKTDEAREALSKERLWDHPYGLTSKFVDTKFPNTPPPGSDTALPLNSPRMEYRAMKFDHAYDENFLKRINDLAKSHHTRVVLITYPLRMDVGNRNIEIVLPLESIFGAAQPLVTVAPEAMFAGMTPEQAKPFYGDDVHLNRNGADAFDAIVLPQIFKEYEKPAP